MPLHLLPKKSYHVQNADNLARVERDKARAAAIDAEQAELLNDYHAAVRLAKLRGHSPPLGPPRMLTEEEKVERVRELARKDESIEGKNRSLSSSTALSHRELKRKRGEDDTERDIRIARTVTGPLLLDRDDGDGVSSSASTSGHRKPRQWNSAVRDSKGHFNLFPEPGRGHAGADAQQSNDDGDARERAQLRRKQQLDPLASVVSGEDRPAVEPRRADGGRGRGSESASGSKGRSKEDRGHRRDDARSSGRERERERERDRHRDRDRDRDHPSRHSHITHRDRSPRRHRRDDRSSRQDRDRDRPDDRARGRRDRSR